MARDELDQLLDQILSEDAKERRAAAKRLGELGRPEAISELVNLYQNDPEPDVRKAAQDALVRFRRLEQEMIGLSDDEESAGPSIDWGSILPKVRLGLGVLLGITVFINAIFFIGSILPKPEPPTPTVAPLTQRPELVQALSARLGSAKTEAGDLRKALSLVQGMGVGGVKPEQCQQFTNSTVNEVHLSQLDHATYPDLRSVNDLINIAALNIFKIRIRYTAVCGSADQKLFDETFKSPNSLPELISQLDNVANKEIPAAEAALNDAIEHPAPTIGPTNTPIPTATPTMPTATPTSVFTATPTTPPVPPTEAATPTATVPAAPDTYTFGGLGLQKFLSYEYRISGTSSGVFTNNRSFNGSALITLKRQTAPNIAQIDMNISEGNPNLRFFQATAGGFYVQGSSTFIILDNVLYETGDILQVAKFNGRCRASHLTQTMLDKAEPYAPNISPDVVLTLKEPNVDVNGATTNHYGGEQILGTKQELLQTIDIYVTADKQVPVKLVTTLTLNAALGAAARTAAGLNELNVTLTYELTAQDAEVSIVKPILCENVPVR